MIKQTIVALLLSVGASSVFAAGTVKVFSNGSSEAKTLTGAEHLIDLVGQPRLANSWWPGAVISEELATAAALRQQQALLTRLAEQGADSSADDAAAINALRQQIQALKVTGRQKINLDPDIVRVAERGNPPLQGNYTLWVGPTAVHGHVVRAYQPWQAAIHSGRDVASYLSDQSLLSGADRGYAWVVYPDGPAKSAGGLLEQASRRADARRHYLCWPRGLRLGETP